eukprot:3260585-Rhodomonas_salina.4
MPYDAYARATRCPVLRQRMILPGNRRHYHAQAGRRRQRSTRIPTYVPLGSQARAARFACCVKDIRNLYGATGPADLASVDRLILVHACYAMPGTDLGHRTTRRPGGVVSDTSGDHTGSGIVLRAVRH